MIQFQQGKISSVVISTILGHSGGGMFPYTLLPHYQKFVRLVRETGTTSLTKSATRFLRRGNYIAWNPLTWKYIKRLPNRGLLNAYGLTNKGVEVCAKRITTSAKKGFKIIPNFYPEFAEGIVFAITETIEAIKIYLEKMGMYFWAIELNFSCPNSKEKINENMFQASRCVEEVRREFPFLIIIVKLSILHPHELAEELARKGANVIHGINTIPHNMVYPGSLSPLNKVGGGGVSGGPAFELAYAYNKGLRKRVKIPIIMGCGVISGGRVKMCFDIGADAVSICTAVRYDPKEAGKIIAKCNT